MAKTGFTDAQQAALYFSRKRRRGGVPLIRLVGQTIQGDADVGDLVGILDVVNPVGEYTFTLTDDAGGLFALDGSDDTRLEVADTLTVGTHVVEVTADNGEDDPIVREFDIVVTAVQAAVFVFAGQSNVRTSGATVVPVNLQTPDEGVKIWNIQTQAWETYEAGVNSETVAAAQNVFGPEGEFARLWRTANPTRTCYIVKYGKGGGASLETDGSPDWDPDHSELFDLAKDEIEAAIADLEAGVYVPTVEAVLWMQGETDAGVEASANAYAVNLAAFKTAVRAEWAAAGTPFFIGRISNSAEWTHRAAVRAAQLSVADADANAEVISTDAYTLQGDDQHYEEVSVAELGEDFYAAYVGTYVDDPTDITVTWRAGFELGVIPEDTATSTVIADLTASNAVVGGTVAFSEVSDPDGKISVSGATLVLAAAVVQGNTHNFTLRATNNLTRTYDEAFSLTGAASTAPTITSGASANNTEDSALAHSLTADQSVTWSIVGGADDEFFEISGSTLRWLSNGVQDFETPLDAGANNTYVVQVRATNVHGEGANQTITITVQADAGVPVNTVAPVISGNTQVGQVLSTTDGTWDDADTFAYQWKRDGSSIGGATSDDYTLVELDAGADITCEVTATNGAGDSDPEASNALGIDVHIVYIGHVEDATDQTTYSGGVWNGVSLGVAAANRIVIVAPVARAAATVAIVNSLSVAGNAATLVKAHRADSDRNGAEIWGVALAAGTTGNLSITYSIGQARCGVGVWAIYGASGVTPADTDGSVADPGSVTLTVPAKGVAIGVAMGIGGVGATWTGLTERYDLAVETTLLHSGADMASNAGGNIAMDVNWSTTPSPASPTAFASWGP